MEKENGYGNINRRSVLKSLAAAGTTSVGLSGVSAGKNTINQTREVPDVKAPDVEEGQRGKVLGEVMSDDHVKKILSEFKNGGWTPRLNEGNYMVVKPQKSDSYKTATIPFEKSGSVEDKQTILTWIEEEIANDIGVPHVTGQRAVKIDSSVSTKSGRGWKVTSYSVEDGEITTTTTHDGVEESNKIEPRDNLAPPPGGGCSTCMVKVARCEDTNYLCMASYISAFIAVVGACGTCYSSAGWVTPACGYCANAIFGGVGLKLVACSNPVDCDGGKWVCADGNAKFCNDHAGEPGVSN